MTQPIRTVGIDAGPTFGARAAMPRSLHVSTILVAALTLLVFAAPIATAQDVFRGRWTSTDLDGSNQTLRIGGSGQAGRHSVALFDDAATAACDGAPARAQGSGTVQGDTLIWAGTITCPGTGKGPVQGRVPLLTFIHDEATDTLIDDSGVVWHRVN